MMLRVQILFALLLSASSFAGSGELDGNWQGVMIRAGNDMSKGTILYSEFKIVDGVLSGYMREEIYNSDLYALKKINGKLVGEELNFKQVVVEKHKRSSRQKWCRMTGKLNYDPVTGYMSGTYESYDCKRVLGKIILYRSKLNVSKDDEQVSSHIWFDKFVKDFKDGLNAPEIRDLERKNFVFEPVFFDFDKSDIRDEHHDFLDRMIKIVKGHSDLRVKVIGHTDSDGTNQYNDGLSKRRAEAIIEYFMKQGLSRDRLEFDFKGETEPIDTNNTSEGKQRNRRVDFMFI
jgi:outer membrane protein OmpA-like peptidoglycan-associated protein